MAAMKISTAVSLTLLSWLSVDFQTIPFSEASRILAIETVAAKSHWNFMSSMLNSLVEVGHNVTVFTPFPDGDRTNYTEVDTSNDFPMKLDLDAIQMIRDFSEPFTIVKAISSMPRYYCDMLHGSQKLVDLLASETRDHYDLLLVEPLTFDCVSYIADTLGLPVIYSIPSPMITFTERIFTGHLSNPSYVSNLLASHAVPVTFAQRFTNTALLTYSMLRTRYDKLVTLITDTRSYDLAPTVNPSIIFQNSHYVTESPRPITPNVVYVGGIHLKPAKTIPEDILDFIEDSPHGVIFFTFGSTIKVSSLPEHIEKAFKDALADVPQRVLWKYEGEMKDKPKNVMTKKWFPQREILLHPKVKLFISHGGMSGVYEAVDGGVPVLGFPLFYDQPRNIEHLVLAGMAISVDLLSISKEKLSNTISKLINDEVYAKNAKIASIRFKDRPMTPQQSVVYWTEYVIRHKGAPHLKSHALNLTWYQYLLLDVIGVVFTFVFLVTYLVCKVSKCIRYYTFKNDKVKPHKQIKLLMAAKQISNTISLTLLFWLSVNLQTIPVTEASRILAIEMVAGKSHWNFMSSVLRSLVEAGHTVTVFTPFLDGDRTNYTEVDTSDDFPMKLDLDAMQTIRDFGEPFALVKTLSGLSRFYCDVIHGNRKLVDLLTSGTRDRYDLLLVEPLTFDCISYIADTLGLPVIYLIPSPMITITERMFTGHLSNPSYVSNLFANHAVPGTFAQRFTNTALLTYSMVRTRYDELVTLITDRRSYDLAPTINPSIIFQNSHYVTESPRPIAPNVVYVGGIHLKPAKTIPEDILDFIENSPHGVIFFTFGSTIKVSSLPEHIEKAFKDALADVPQRVLWKYEGEMKDKPKNVMTKKWFPQREILLHPKVKLFISHGGMSGVYEAVDGGVPVLGFPLFYDQPRNIEHLVLAGMAISMDLLSISKEKLSNTISKLINDEVYAKNAKIASIRFKDRPMTPQQSVVYWTEYVIRHKGAPHLKSHALNLTWYQYLLLDVIGVVFTFVFLVIYLVCKVLKCIRYYTFKNDKVKTN
ncbi:uncharacterized protein LOC113557729 [Rhopalosiphum maidis]|uniref:uncharacterized protein LOC113557729 n=1 Tax=Rhopalosiphum maidis TaxID=43146 RepID=UPI00101BC195|nr:uncharacterized protein LOC113557729 [Rhopalosiphum maidis]